MFTCWSFMPNPFFLLIVIETLKIFKNCYTTMKNSQSSWWNESIFKNDFCILNTFFCWFFFARSYNKCIKFLTFALIFRPWKLIYPFFIFSFVIFLHVQSNKTINIFHFWGKNLYEQYMEIWFPRNRTITIINRCPWSKSN